jgi:hypothetical protein
MKAHFVRLLILIPLQSSTRSHSPVGRAKKRAERRKRSAKGNGSKSHN